MYYNLLNQPEKLTRDITVRLKDKQKNSELANKFGFEYFDGPRAQGYGGYIYDGRWLEVADRLIKKYQLTMGSSFLDVGCAKGFLLQDLQTRNDELILRGIDCSEYAKSKASPSVQSLIDIGCCSELPYDDNSFDAVVSINTIHNLEPEMCRMALRELVRVVKNKSNIFIQVDCCETQDEKDIFDVWALTARTCLTSTEWLTMFQEEGFSGDYFWTTIGFSS